LTRLAVRGRSPPRHAENGSITRKQAPYDVSVTPDLVSYVSAGRVTRGSARMPHSSGFSSRTKGNHLVMNQPRRTRERIACLTANALFSNVCDYPVPTAIDVKFIVHPAYPAPVARTGGPKASRDRTGPEPAGTRWVHAEPAGRGMQRAPAVTTGN
jgi:hypothetical protein